MEMTDKEKLEMIKDALRSFYNDELTEFATLFVIDSIVSDPPSEEEIEKMREWALNVLGY